MKRILMSVRDGRGFDIVLVAFPLGFLFLMAGLPLIYNVVMSFQEVDMFSLGTFSRPFVGFKNYTDLFAQPETLPILYNTVIFVVGSIAGQFLIGFGLALFFWVNFPGASWMRGLFLVSWVMPGLVVGAIWNWILSGDFGVLNFILKESGIISGNIFWRSDPHYSLYAVIIANVWLGTSFNMILLSVGAIIALGLIFTLQQFDLFAAITSGGPNNSSNVTQYWAWDLSFRQYDFAKGATISVIMIVFVMFASVVYVRSTRHEVRG
jgi:multiple sugar transport system permease protein